MPTPAYSNNQRANSGIWLGPTVGRSSPKNNRRACLCVDSNTYSRRCCDGYLINQGIGNIQQTEAVATDRAFSDGFSNGFS